MNAIEAMMLTEEAARNYLGLIDQRIYSRYGEMLPSEVASIVLSLREELDYSEDDSSYISPNEVLSEVIDALDELDDDDYFGPWGWRSGLMGEV